MKHNATIAAAILLALAPIALAQQGDPADHPAGEGCGRISAFTSMPRSERLFPIILRRIDGIEIPAAGVSSVRVEAGKRVVMLADAIPPVEFNMSERAALRQLRNRRMNQFKFFEIDVEPNTTYLLAAKLAPYPRDVVNNAHWEPVVWKTRAERCR